MVAVRCRVPKRAERNRLHRGQERNDRISLGRGSIRSTACARRRPRPTPRFSYSRDRRFRSGLAAKATTSIIPIVFTTGGDPVTQGLVTSLGRPGGNVTGVSFFTSELLLIKRLELLHELLPTATEIVLFVNPTGPNAESNVSKAQQQATSFGQRLRVLRTSTEQHIDAAVATFAQLHPGGLIIEPDPVLNARREQFVALAARHAVPAIYEGRESVDAGGLMSYGPSLSDAYRQVGIYTGRILKGAKPADLPVLRATKFELVINMKTAKTLGLTIPQSLLLRADEVIQ
jgi:putative ABC transport system substrate-binding protein